MLNKHPGHATANGQPTRAESIAALKSDVKFLSEEAVRLNQHHFPEWISEKEAAKDLGLNPRYLRYLATTGARAIRFKRSRSIGFLYLKSDINNFKS